MIGMDNYKYSEKKSTVLRTNDSSNVWDLYTREQEMIKRMKNLDIEPCRIVTEGDEIIEAWYQLEQSQIQFTKSW